MTRRRALWLSGTGALLGVLASIALVDAWVFARVPPVRKGPMVPVMPLASLSAEQCRACHTEIYDEWQASGHARAETDVLYRADFELEGRPFYCNHCHAPLTEQQPELVQGLWLPWPRLVPRTGENPSYEPALQHEGVTCVACHQKDGAMHGPFATSVAPHPVQETDALRDPALCETCHVLDSAFGTFQRPIMETLSEWREYRRQGGERVCVDCHLPAGPARAVGIGGPERPSRSHRLRGPWDADFVRTAVGVNEVVMTRGDNDFSASIRLVNQTGHRLPTGEPHRRLVVSLDVQDERGKPLAHVEERVERVVDLATLTERPGEDTTLLPRESRPMTLRVGALPPAARSVRLRVEFWLWSPEDAVALRAGVGPEDLVHLLFERSEKIVAAAGRGPS